MTDAPWYSHTGTQADTVQSKSEGELQAKQGAPAAAGEGNEEVRRENKSERCSLSLSLDADERRKASKGKETREEGKGERVREGERQ